MHSYETVGFELHVSNASRVMHFHTTRWAIHHYQHVRSVASSLKGTLQQESFGRYLPPMDTLRADGKKSKELLIVPDTTINQTQQQLQKKQFISNRAVVDEF